MSKLSIGAVARLALEEGLQTRSEILAWVARSYPGTSPAERHEITTRTFTLMAAEKRAEAATAPRSTHEDVRGPMEPPAPEPTTAAEGLLPPGPELRGAAWGESWKETPITLREAFESALRLARHGDREPSAQEALEQAQRVWSWPFTPQAFFIGPWRRAAPSNRATPVRKRTPAEAPAPQPTTGASPVRTQPVTPQQGAVRLEGPAGMYSAWPADVGAGMWEIELRVRCTRDVALHLQGQAFSILFPDAARRIRE